MRKILSLVLVVGMAVANAAEPPAMPPMTMPKFGEVVKSAAGATVARFPDADRVMVDDRIYSRYEADGTDVTWDDEWVKVLTEKGRRSLASVSIDYNARYGDAGIALVEIVGADGKVRKVDFEKTLKEATDNSSMGSNIVDPLDKVIRCAVPGLAVGDIRHVRTWRRTRRARMRNTWADYNLFESTQPILATTIYVEQPKELPLAHAVVRNPFGKTVSRAKDESVAGGRILSSWTVRDVPQAFPEPNMPSFSRCVQSLQLSTIKDWPTVSRWYWSICEKHLAKTNPAMTNFVNTLVKDCRDEEARVRAVFKFVSQEVRYMGLTLEDDAPGYEPHDVDVTFANRYGVCRDKAGLLVALLRIAGVKAFPVLIHAGAKMDPDVPTPYFNHAIVAMSPSGKGAEKYILMDPTNESTKDIFPAYLSGRSYLVARPEGEGLRTSPVVSADRNTMTVKSEATLDPSGEMLLTTQFTFGGINDSYIRSSLLRKTAEERRKWFSSVLRAASAGAELLSLELLPLDLRDTDTALTARTIARLPGTVLRGETRDELSLPYITRVLSIANGLIDDNTALVRRRFPLELSSTAATEEQICLKFGEALGRAVAIPEPVDRRTPGYRFARKITVKNGELTASRSMRVEDVNFNVPAYDALRNARVETETAERAKPAFARRADSDANVRVRLRAYDYSFTSPRSWVCTNTVEKEVLTYRGKKTSSELKFDYAPSTKGVELVSAVVSNRNGKVFTVTPKEINLMDCGWASAAPRYPASKILVVNLPGVEIGSVVRYTVVYNVTNSPVAWSTSYQFGEFDPVDMESFKIKVPDALDFKFSNRRFLDKAGRPREAGARFTVATNSAHKVYTWQVTNPNRTPNESAQPPAGMWQTGFVASFADWGEYGEELAGALAKARDDGSAGARKLGADIVKGIETPEGRIGAIRAKLAHTLRVVGPGLFELPFGRAFTAPDRVLVEGYASGADRTNLMMALLEGAGFDCRLVLVANDARGFRVSEAQRRRMPRLGTFGSLVVRAAWKEGWLPGFRSERVFWVAGENEYTPARATSREGDSFYDPAADAFGRIELGADDADWASRTEDRVVMSVRENGAVDFEVRNRVWGSGVGGMRKRFVELLPEMRSRFYQELLGGLSQNTTATSELDIDVKGYPFEIGFKAYAEGYAVVKDGVATVRLPAFGGGVFGVGVVNGDRRSPIAINGYEKSVDEYVVVFPKGFTAVEALPKPFQICNPLSPAEVWLKHEVTKRVLKSGCLEVTVRRTVERDHSVMFGRDMYPFFDGWNRRAGAAEVRTISVRQR